MMPLTAAKELAAETIPAILEEAGLEHVLVTLDILEVPAAVHNGPVILVQPPAVEYVTYSHVVATWELVVIAGPPRDALAAWAAIDPVIEALRGPLSLEKSFPSTFAHPNMPDHPAYALEFTDTI